jgi:hypothetical protein
MGSAALFIGRYRGHLNAAAKLFGTDFQLFRVLLGLNAG